MDEMKSKQAITGFKVVRYSVKRVKDSEKIVLLLEADVDDIGCGEYDMGDVQGALLNHRVSDSDVGLSLFMKK
jgi:hypothetical protein